MALILLSEEDIDPTGSDVRCVRNDYEEDRDDDDHEDKAMVGGVMDMEV